MFMLLRATGSPGHELFLVSGLVIEDDGLAPNKNTGALQLDSIKLAVKSSARRRA